MQIVIEITNETYRYMQSRFMYQSKDESNLSIFEKAGVAIKNGTPLPKGHGRLIDADAMYDDFEKGEYDFEEALEYAPTIIMPESEVVQ